MTSGTDGSDPAGAVAQEAKRLAEAVSDWARSAHTEAGHQATADDRESGATEASARPGASCSCGESAVVGAVCGVCPICRVATMVQAIQPEVIERVADVLGMVAGSLQAVAEDRRRAEATNDAQAAPGADTPGDPDSDHGGQPR